MNKRRLLKLAEFLETKVPREHFNMAVIAKGKCDLSTCGSAGCAIGWLPACFPKSDLKLVDIDGMIWLRSEGIEGTDFSVAAEFLSIDKDSASFLFSNIGPFGDTRNDESPAEVAARIRNFVKQGGIPSEAK